MVIYARESSWIDEFCSASQIYDLCEICARFRISASATDLAAKL
ncbi:hypothetical protein ENTCAN_07366 [Enterobacter cancerogenus ATCC 35316]|nr:hypothetical protein ENTCAN_07366 [Enterobacter cancerogenus ATCC 35316]